MVTSLPCSGCRNECLSEMLGTFILVFIGPASVVIASLIPYFSRFEALIFVAFVFGSTVASVIILLIKYSGAHINPAMTVAKTLAGMLDRELFVPYVVFQMVGGLLAGLSLKLVFGSVAPSMNLGSTGLALGVSPAEGVALEIVGTFILAISALSASSFIRSPVRQGVLVGTTLFALIMFIGPFTGASFNPARSLGPSLFSGFLNGQLIYWIGPTIGAACAGSIFGLGKKYHARTTKKLDIVCVC
jgi:MIP family channel proteins